MLRLIALGKIVSEICQDLVFSAKTNSAYHSRALEKIALKNNTELISGGLSGG